MGDLVGSLVGSLEGTRVGTLVGTLVGILVGVLVGALVGAVGFAVGLSEGLVCLTTKLCYFEKHRIHRQTVTYAAVNTTQHRTTKTWIKNTICMVQR